MICPRCKKQIPNETINCPHCNMKIGTVCKRCGSYNLINNKSCIECGLELVKFCPHCKSANFPNATSCRKCGYSFKKIGLTNNNQQKIIPPRQFVLPALASNQAEIKQNRNRTVIKQVHRPIPQHMLNHIQFNEEDPLIPEQNLLTSEEKILSRKLSSKKVSNSSKPQKKVKKIIKKVKKKQTNAETEILQSQLNSLQSQLSGLQEQLNVIPQQLNAMQMKQQEFMKEKEALQKEVSEVKKQEVETKKLQEEVKKIELLKKKEKEKESTQKSVLPENKNKKLTNEKQHNPKKSSRIVSPLKSNHAFKGILPFKSNVLPNRHNVIPNPRNIAKPKNILSEAANKQQQLKVNDDKNNETILFNKEENGGYKQNLFTQKSAKNILVNTLLNTSVKIISLSGESGIGKNVVLKATIEELKDNMFVWLVGKATPLSQITPCGLFQDMLLTFFNVPNFCVNTDKLRKDSAKFFKSEFSKLKPDEIDDLINFLYPEKTAYYENIFENKARTFSILRTVLDTISSRMQTVIIIDNFEHIDTMSYEFLKTLIDANTGLINTKIILSYTEQKSAKAYLYDKYLPDSAYADVSLIPFNSSQTENFINQYNPLFVGTSLALREQIHTQTYGNPAYIEQILNLITDCSRNYIQFNLPNSFEAVIKARLDILKQENILVYELLLSAAIVGLKFYPVVLNQLFKVDDKTFIDLFSSLLDLNYITPVNESAYEFKSTKLWKAILNVAKTDKNFMKFSEKLFVILSEFTLSSHSSLALLATNLKENLSALNAWSEVVRLSAGIGDENIYVIAQKYSLLLVDKLQGVNSSLIKNNIYERLGKIMSFSNPKAAIEYLPRVIEHVRRLEDNLKEFELTGYLAQCCHKVGNHFGVIECIDSAISNVDPSYELEISMLKSRKLDSLLKIGNLGEIVNLIDYDILPEFERNLDTSKQHKNIKIEDLFEAWLETYLILAKSLVLQGDNRAIAVIGAIFEIIEKNNIHNDLYICKAKLTLALANTLKGDIKESEVILAETLKQYKNNDIMDTQAITFWNLISILNCISRNKLEGIQDELFQIVTFVNNNNDIFTKNILKLLLGKTLKEKGKFKLALTIYSEQVAYFAKEKNALGVLMSWYFIAELTLLTAGPEKSLEYSLKALDIAQSPKIQNYYFITQFNKIIGEAYLALQDFDSAKAYIESGIGIARQFDLLDILSELYFLYGKYLQELATIKSDSQRDYASSAFKMYDKAVNLAQKLHNSVLVSVVMSANTELRRYCQKNDIHIR